MPIEAIVTATAEYVHAERYFGLVGVDILRDKDGSCFLIDVNPRLTETTPFLMASRIFNNELSFDEGIYQADLRLSGKLDVLIAAAESFDDCRVIVMSAFEDVEADTALTICNISVSSNSQARNHEISDQLVLA